MIKKITVNPEVDSENIQIAGFKSNLTNFNLVMNKLSNMDPDCIIQLMDADSVAGTEHILHATVHAIKAFSRDENIAKDLGLEICVRTSGQRQISQALKMLGIKNGPMNICAVAVGCEKNIMDSLVDILGSRDDAVLEPDTNKLRSLYNITDTELETTPNISKILMEKTALLIIET